MQPEPPSLTHEKHGSGAGYSAYFSALEAAYTTGVVVVNELFNNWGVYQDKLAGD